MKPSSYKFADKTQTLFESILGIGPLEYVDLPEVQEFFVNAKDTVVIRFNSPMVPLDFTNGVIRLRVNELHTIERDGWFYVRLWWD